MLATIAASTEARLLKALRARGDAKRAEWEKAYQKSRWEHWGVALPGMDAAIRETLGDLTQAQAVNLPPACGASRSGTSRSSRGGFWRENRSSPTQKSGRS